jgi:hypothetical protein
VFFSLLIRPTERAVLLLASSDLQGQGIDTLLSKNLMEQDPRRLYKGNHSALFAYSGLVALEVFQLE